MLKTKPKEVKEEEKARKKLRKQREQRKQSKKTKIKPKDKRRRGPNYFAKGKKKGYVMFIQNTTSYTWTPQIKDLSPSHRRKGIEG